MPKSYLREFRDDVVAVTPGRGHAEAGREGFRVSESCLTNWLEAADAEDGQRTGASLRDDSAELAELRERNRLLEQENEVLRRAAAYLSRDINPK